jgi:hypothetical protein
VDVGDTGGGYWNYSGSSVCCVPAAAACVNRWWLCPGAAAKHVIHASAAVSARSEEEELQTRAGRRHLATRGSRTGRRQSIGDWV